MDILQIFGYIVLLPSAIFHEYMHAWVADRLGDPTARYAGRLTLNPKSHIDPLNTILIPMFLLYATGGRFMFASAKPVPYNPYNLKDQRFGPLLVAIAGPLSNFALAFVFGLVVRAMPGTILGSLFAVIVYVNIVLGVFNLVPIPPLDGSKVLFAFLPDSMAHIKFTLERFGFYILIFFIASFPGLLTPIMEWIFRLFVGVTV